MNIDIKEAKAEAEALRYINVLKAEAEAEAIKNNILYKEAEAEALKTLYNNIKNRIYYNKSLYYINNNNREAFIKGLNNAEAEAEAEAEAFIKKIRPNPKSIIKSKKKIIKKGLSLIKKAEAEAEAEAEAKPLNKKTIKPKKAKPLNLDITNISKVILEAKAEAEAIKIEYKIKKAEAKPFIKLLKEYKLFKEEEAIKFLTPLYKKEAKAYKELKELEPFLKLNLNFYISFIVFKEYKRLCKKNNKTYNKKGFIKIIKKAEAEAEAEAKAKAKAKAEAEAEALKAKAEAKALKNINSNKYFNKIYIKTNKAFIKKPFIKLFNNKLGVTEEDLINKILSYPYKEEDLFIEDVYNNPKDYYILRIDNSVFINSKWYINNYYYIKLFKSFLEEVYIFIPKNKDLKRVLKYITLKQKYNNKEANFITSKAEASEFYKSLLKLSNIELKELKKHYEYRIDNIGFKIKELNNTKRINNLIKTIDFLENKINKIEYVIDSNNNKEALELEAEELEYINTLNNQIRYGKGFTINPNSRTTYDYMELAYINNALKVYNNPNDKEEDSLGDRDYY